MKKTLVVVGLVGLALMLWAPGGQGADPAPDKEPAALRQRLAALEARLKALEGAVQVSGGGVKIVSAGTLSLHGAAMVDVKSAGTLSLQGAATVDIKGGLIKLNGGGKSLARLGDRVVVQPAAPGAPTTGQIAEGSPTVLVGP